MFTATHFLRMLSALFRRNAQSGNRLAPIYSNSEIISNTNQRISVDNFLAFLILVLWEQDQKKEAGVVTNTFF